MTKDLKREFTFTDSDFRFIAKLAYDRLGIVLGDHKRDMVYGRIAKRLRALGFKSVKEYCQFLTSDKAGDEVIDFINAITTNLTRFFRETHHFDFLKENLLEKSKSKEGIKIWSAGCSAGMESYSIAMVLHDALVKGGKRNCKILASDIDTNMLDKGSSGVYDGKILEDVPIDYRKYIVRDRHNNPTEIKMADELRNLIAFKRLNLMDASWPMKGKFDYIFCRNVVIYFSVEKRKILFDRFANQLADDGIMFIGHSENLHGISDRFQLIGRTIYKKIK